MRRNRHRGKLIVLLMGAYVFFGSLGVCPCEIAEMAFGGNCAHKDLQGTQEQDDACDCQLCAVCGHGMVLHSSAPLVIVTPETVVGYYFTSNPPENESPTFDIFTPPKLA